MRSPSIEWPEPPRVAATLVLLQPLQVIKQDDETYFSENNRRLWVLKKCREHGLLKAGTVPVRVKLLKENTSKKKNRDRWSKVGAYSCNPY